jgi:mutator family transposase
LSLVEGSTENATLVSELLVGLRERGLDVTGPILRVLDGSTALRRAVLDVFDHPVIARCQLHKLRNVQDRLPQKLRSVVAKRMRAVYHGETALGAQAELETLAGELEHPSRRGCLAARGPSRDPDRPAPGCATHPGPHPAQHQLRGEHDRNLSGPLPQRQTLAGRDDGAALVRCRHHRSRQAVPPGQRSPTPTGAANRSPTACRSRKCQSQRAQSHQQRSLMITGPPPKIYEVRDILLHDRHRTPSGSPRTSPLSGPWWLGASTGANCDHSADHPIDLRATAAPLLSPGFFGRARDDVQGFERQRGRVRAAKMVSLSGRRVGMDDLSNANGLAPDDPGLPRRPDAVRRAPWRRDRRVDRGAGARSSPGWPPGCALRGGSAGSACVCMTNTRHVIPAERSRQRCGEAIGLARRRER